MRCEWVDPSGPKQTSDVALTAMASFRVLIRVSSAFQISRPSGSNSVSVSGMSFRADCRPKDFILIHEYV